MMIKKTLLLLSILVVFSMAQTTHLVWKYLPNGQVRPGFDKATSLYHVTGSADEESSVFGTREDFNGLLTIEYKSDSSTTALSFDLLVGTGTSYIAIPLTFTELTDVDGKSVFKWKSEPQSGDIVLSSPYSSFKIVMHKSASVDITLKMIWKDY